MKTKFTFFILMFLLIASRQLSAQGVVLSYFNAKSEGANVKVQWEIDDESGVSEYRLFRKVTDSGNFEKVTTLYSNGNLTYDYLDDDIFKNEARVITYELQIVRNGSIHKFYTTLSHNPTAIERTWGSIKSMFKK